MEGDRSTAAGASPPLTSNQAKTSIFSVSQREAMQMADHPTDDLAQELKQKIIQALDLVGELDPNEIGDDDRLVGGDFGIDSIDVLEIVVMLEKDYGVLIDNKELGEQVFTSLRTLADFVRERRTKAPE
jgi:acyl carrier protein